LGAKPLVHYEDEASYWAAVEEGRANLIGAPGSHEWAALAETDVYVYFWGPEDNGRLDRLPAKTSEKLVEFNPEWYKRAAKYGVRGVRMAIARATPANARHWGVSLSAWQKELAASSALDPETYRNKAEKLRRSLEGAGKVRVRHPNGTDLSLRLVRRKATTVLGLATPSEVRKGPRPFGVMANVPDGSVYVAVDERTAEGTVVANRNLAGFGSPIRGAKWTFRGGRLVRQSYEEGGDIVRKAFAAGKDGRDRPGMLEVGLDPKARIAPMMQENELGAVSIGIGSNAGFGGKTRANFNAILTVAGAELTVGDRTVVRGGHVF